MDTSNITQPPIISTPPSQTPTFEQQFTSSVQSELPQIGVKAPKSPRAKASLIISLLLCIGLIVGGFVMAFVSADQAPTVESSSEENSLREVESKTLSETGFSAEYYVALDETSSVVEQRYAAEDAMLSENQGGFDIIKSGAIYFFIAAGIALVTGISLFIKL